MTRLSCRRARCRHHHALYSLLKRLEQSVFLGPAPQQIQCGVNVSPMEGEQAILHSRTTGWGNTCMCNGSIFPHALPCGLRILELEERLALQAAEEPRQSAADRQAEPPPPEGSSTPGEDPKGTTGAPCSRSCRHPTRGLAAMSTIWQAGFVAALNKGDGSYKAVTSINISEYPS